MWQRLLLIICMTIVRVMTSVVIAINAITFVVWLLQIINIKIIIIYIIVVIILFIFIYIKGDKE